MKHRREILAIAIPAIISNLSTPVLSLVDVAVTGHIGAAVYIGAIAVGGAMFNMLYWLFGFLRMGSSGLTAQAFGADDKARESLVLWRALLVALGAGALMVLLSGPLCRLVLGFMDADGATAALASRYFRICIWGAPAVLASYSMAGWFVGMQNSRAAMWMAICTNVINIAVSLALVFGFGMKIEGVATGTLTAQWLGLIPGVVIIARRYRPAFPPRRQLLAASELLAFSRVNADIFLRTCCLVAVTLWFTHAGAVQGTDILAANALLLQLFMLFSYFMDGFAYAGEALAGKYDGGSDHERLHSLIAALLRTGTACSVAFAVLYGLAGEWFMSILTSDAGVVATARAYLPWAVALPLCAYLAFVWDGICIGLVATRAMLVAMVVAVGLFFVIYFAAGQSLGNHALWLAFDSYLFVRGILEWIIARRLRLRRTGRSRRA